MKRKDIQELHNKSTQELKESMKKTQEELVKLRTDLGAGKLKDVHQIKKKRRDLARIKTIIRKKELEGLPAGR